MTATGKEIRVAMAVICQVDEYVLELREQGTSNGAIGLIGCFGGVIEDGELPAQAVAREVMEETNLRLTSDSYRHVGFVEVQSDRDGQPVFIHSEVFETLLPYNFEVKALRGNLVRMKLEDIAAGKEKLTPATRAAFEKYYLEEN